MIRTIRVVLEKDRAVQLCSYNSRFRIILKADSKNVGRVVLGGSDVTPATGFPVDGGEKLELPQVDYSTFYVSSTAKGDVVYLLIW